MVGINSDITEILPMAETPLRKKKERLQVTCSIMPVVTTDASRVTN